MTTSGRSSEYVTPRPLAELRSALCRLGVASELVLPDGEMLRFGHGPAAFRIVLRTDLPLTVPLSDFSLARAYVNGDIDVDGDLMSLLSLRELLHFDIPVSQILRLGADLLLPPTLANTRAIDFHYSLGDDFYLTFLDRKYHFYSQCLFHSDEETLEQAAEHKLERMWDALALEPGMRLLDIGGGWGGLAAYAGERGVHVTSLTLMHESAGYIRRRTSDLPVPAEVLVEDVLDHFPSHPYDHAVIFGVIEHVPNYRRFCERVWGALRPGGRLYVDASATREKYASSAFTREYTWRGPHSCLALQDLIEELLFHGFDVLEVRQESHDYELTMGHWAARFDAAHCEVAGRWSEAVYRAFRIFLWGGTYGFRTNRLQAYSLVAERRADPGPRPGGLRRLAHFVASSVSR
jgi:cyclopropane-fatty-acyl-phospholipid synthase